jgi:hypothetical protein
MEAPSTSSPADWWHNQRTNYIYVAMASGILCFLAFVAIWETFYGFAGTKQDGMKVIGGILLNMVQHLVIWVPFLLLEIYAYRLLPKLDARFNPTGRMDTRRQILIIGCVVVCFLPLLLPTILVMVHG